ncbi:MAG: diaminopimelate epimerase [Dehalococcoidia bacterium]
MKFPKLQATGNDFVLVDALTASRKSDRAELARAICDCHFGVGADGLMLAEHSTIADLKMRIFNSDGSEADISGNGLRCFARYAIEKGLVDKISARARQRKRLLTVETLSGVRKIEAYMSGNKVKRVKVNMGLPRFQPAQIPVKIAGHTVPILNYPLDYWTT